MGQLFPDTNEAFDVWFRSNLCIFEERRHIKKKHKEQQRTEL